MTKHLHLRKVLATLLTIAALAAGQQAFATITETFTFKGNVQTVNNTNSYNFEVGTSVGIIEQLAYRPGTSCQFNNAHLSWGPVIVTLNGTLQFQVSNTLTDVVVQGSTFTVTFQSQSLWFYGASVKKLNGTNVTNSSVTVSSDKHTVTVTINGNGTEFGQIILDYVPNEPFSSSNTVIGGVEAEYIYTGRPIEPVPTVIYNGTVLTAGTYTVSYSNTTGPGSASVTVTGTGQYAGTVTRNYNIRAVALSDFYSLDNNTYEIATTTDLDHLAGYVNLGNDCQGLTFKQTADITYTYTTAWNNSSSTENNYTAIGTNATPFRGTFDGQNYSISGIRVYYKGDKSLQGLFGYLNNSTVKRVHLADARITSENYVGGIAGNSFQGTVEDCTVANNVAIHAVANESFNHGGIVGGNQGTVQRCISHATLSVASNVVGGGRYGGVVGHNFNGGSVTDCIAIGAIVPNIEDHGAIAGKNHSNSTLQRNFYRNCTVAGTANATNVGCDGTDIITNQGALALYSLTLPDNVTTDRTASAILPGTGNKTYTTGADINGTPYYCQGGNVTLVYNNLPEGYRANYTATGGTINGNILTMPAANVTVTVALVPDWSGNGTQTNPYVITTTAQLDALANEVKSGQTYSGTYFVLGNDIAYSTEGLGDTDENFTTIGGYFNGDKNFSGNFNGQGHTISGIRLYKNGTAAPSMNQGLFGRISDATIQNVILTDARITGYRYVGGLVGNKVSGTVQNCLVLESTITCENTYVGALFGKNNGTLANNYYHGCTVNGTANATNVGVGGNGGTSSSSDKNGARSAHTLTLGENVTATPAPAVTYNNINYYTAGTEITLGAPQGYAITSATLTYGGSDYPIVGNSFEMPAQDVAVTAVLQARYTFNSTTGVLALLWGEFNKDNKWGSEVTESAVTSVTATDEVSFTGDCYKLFYNFTSCTSMDLTDVNTANVTNMSNMFYGCSGLQSLDLSGWNTANVTDMKYMFYGCSGLQSLDLSGWNTTNVTDMKYMFYGCRRLQSLNISGWNTANVTNMKYMFYGCRSLQSLNISGWNTANVTNMSGMFYGCSGLTTIYAGEGWNTSRVNESTDMFDGCTSLVGGMGTAYDANHTGGEYARIDRGPNSDQPGYFTGRFTKEIAGYEDNESGWYLIASPLAADIAPTAVTNMTNETFDLYYFDQTGGTNGKEWKNWKNEGGDGYHFNLKTGKGYLYANSGNVTLEFTGVPYSGNGQVTLTKADGFEFSGWNLIGNPFSTAATLDKPFYRMNESGTALSAQVEAHNSVAAMEGVFVQASTNNETATFTQANNSKGGEKDAVPMLTLNLTRNRGEAIDNAILRFDGGHTLEKFSFREGSTKIYIPQDGTDYAIATSNGQGEMPVNFKATENGTYTLTISTTLNSQLSTLNYLHLIDNMTGADVDLLTPEPVEGPATYTFTAKTTDYASRFKLVFSANGNADGDNDAFAFIDASGNIIVNGEGTLQVMDVMGRIIVSHGGHTRCVPTTGLTAGVYVLRLIDGENVRTQKIVIS